MKGMLGVNVKLIDLSRLFTPGMPVYPGEPKMTLELCSTIKRDGYTNHQLISGMHVGTHIDAPLHFVQDGKKISDISLDRFYGSAVLVDARNKKVIDIDAIQKSDIKKDDIVLILTGHDRFYGKAEYFTEQPIITEEFARKMIEIGIKMLGVDMASPDTYPFSVHRLLLPNEILILENLTNLDQLIDQDFQLFAFPIKFEADAAFVRTVAKIE